MKNFVFAIAALMLCQSALAKRAPDFSLADSRGKTVSLQDFAGKVLVLYFMSFQCPHCKNIQPTVQQLHKESRGDYAMLGVVFGTRQDELAAAAVRSHISFSLAVGTRAIRDSFKVPGTPYFELIDAEGNLKERYSGEIGAAVLQQTLRTCSADPAGLNRCLAAQTGLRNLVRTPSDFEGKAIKTGGLLSPGGGPYFPNPRFLITNGIDRLAVSAWLPVEVAPTPPQARHGAAKDLMSDWQGRYVSLEGRLRKIDGQPLLEVMRATPGR